MTESWTSVDPGFLIKNPVKKNAFKKNPVSYLFKEYQNLTRKKSDKKAYSSNKFAVANKSKAIMEIIKQVKPEFKTTINYMDYGCGDGTESLAIRDSLVKLGYKVSLTQCDVSDLRTLSEEEKKGIKFAKLDPETPVDFSGIDFLTLFNVLHHLPDPSKVIEKIQNIPFVLIREHDVSASPKYDSEKRAIIYLQHILYEIAEIEPGLNFEKFKEFVTDYPKKFNFIPMSDIPVLFPDHQISKFPEQRYDFRYHVFLINQS